ncbi:MAG TPA: polysaccharide deacetylase [Candidatus Anaerofilum excrementigallinarum]|nr:polysaccharide deacetylase [Candidatus Anaerofilum excrementigallinarum]
MKPLFSPRCLRVTGVLAVIFCLGALACRALSPGTAGCRQEDLSHWPAALNAEADAGASSPPTEKRVFLTFDDGPSATTETILDTLAEKQVKASFFVIAAENNEKYLPLVQRIQEEGHTIALHSASHDYSDIYSSTAAYWQDIDLLLEKLSPYLTAQPSWLRFPGGSTNTVSRKYGGSGLMEKLVARAAEKGYQVLDWNVSAEDAVGSHPSASRILENIQSDSRGKTTCVVLMHDTNATPNTAKALPDIIDWYAAEGYRFCTLSEEAP